MSADLSTVTVSDVIARRPCGDWSSRIPALVTQYRRERWSALEILSLDGVSAEDRLWVCFHDSLVPDRVMVRFACEVAADAMRVAGWTDPRSWAALEARLAYARGEIDAAARAAWAASAARAARAAWAARAARAASNARAAWAASAASNARAAWAARAASAASNASDAQIRTLRTLILLDLDGYDVLRGELGGVVPRKGCGV